MRKAKPVNPMQYAGPNAKVPFLAPDVITKVIPSPVEGLDAISPLAEMDPKRAVILNNFVPRPGFVELRGGYQPWSATSSGKPVESVIVYRSQNQQRMFAASGKNIYDVSNNAPATVVVSSVANDRWQYVNFTPSGAATVVQLVNGVDPLLMYNGTSWTNPSITGLPGSFTTGDIVNIWADKQRLWYVFNNSTQVSFMPTQAIMGPIAGSQDFGALWTKGGHMVAVGTWTIDGGNGPQAYTIFLSSEGQCSVYAGDDPTNASAWSLVGTFSLPPPIGTRCLLPLGSDLAIITQQGVLPLSQALPFDPSADRSVAITTRIQNLMSQYALQAGTNFGWEMALYPNQQLLIINVPLAVNNQQNQLVQNTLTGAWCQFTGWNANTFAIFNSNLYWGDNNGNVNLAYTSGIDNLTSIVGDMQCAFNWFDEPGRLKRMTMLQPLLNIGGGLSPTLAIDVDFTSSTFASPVSTTAQGAIWDSSTWDMSSWTGGSNNLIEWLSVEAIGHALAVHMRVTAGAASTQSAVFDSAQFDNAVFDSGISTIVPVLQVNAFNSILELGGAV